MSTKLTLIIDKAVIKKAKKYAKSQGITLSNLVEAYLKSVSINNTKTEKLKLSPITKSLFGSVKLKNENMNHKKMLEDEILKKHL